MRSRPPAGELRPSAQGMIPRTEDPEGVDRTQAELRRRVGETENNLSVDDRVIIERAHTIANNLKKRLFFGNGGRRLQVLQEVALIDETTKFGMQTAVYDTMVDLVAIEPTHLSPEDRRVQLICQSMVQNVELAVRARLADAEQALRDEHTDSAIMGFAVDYATTEYYAEQQQQEQSARDPLTGLIKDPSYFAKLFELQRERLRAGEEDNCMLVVEIDLDDFKGENDHNPNGHAGVDRDIIVPMANAFKEKFREFDVLARMGGDEFTFILNGVKSEAIVLVVAKVQQAVNAIQRHNGQPMTTSIGYYVIEKNNIDHVLGAEQARSLADNAAIYAKEHGGNQAVRHQEGLELGPPTHDRVRRKILKGLYRSFPKVNFDRNPGMLDALVDEVLLQELATYHASHPATDPTEEV